MGTCRTLLVAFILWSLFMILFITVYWEDVGGFSLHLLRDSKQKALRPGCCNQTNAGRLQPTSHGHAWTTAPPTTTTTTSFRNVLIPPPTPTGEQREEEEGKEEEETLEGEENERSPVSVIDGEQKARKQRIMDMCSGESSFEFPGRTRSLSQIPNSELKNLIVDDKQQIIYCYVPKVACTNWKRVISFLSQTLISPSSGKPYTDPRNIPADRVHNSSLYLTLEKFSHNYGSLSHHMMALKLQHYTKFLFVRDPFVRLISAFRSKFEKPNENFYRWFGMVMLRRYGNATGPVPETVEAAHAAGIKPTFQQFITYLLDPETEKEKIFNEHWLQVYRLCHPCQVKYDFIGKVETLETDAEHLLKLLKVDHLLRFPSGQANRTAASWEKQWFAQIPLKTQRELYRLYEPDFKMFGYPKPDSLLND